MKRIVILLSILSNILFSAYLTVSSSAGVSAGSDGSIRLDALSATFSNLEVSSSNQFIEIPIYVKSDTLEAISLTINNIVPLNQNGESIPFSLSYKDSEISSGVAFSLLNAGEGGRDGNTVVGKIKILIPSVSATQVAGDYAVSMSMELSSANYGSSATEMFSIGATVPLVAIAGFNTTSSLTNGQHFEGATLDYGTFSFNQKNTITYHSFHGCSFVCAYSLVKNGHNVDYGVHKKKSRIT